MNSTLTMSAPHRDLIFHLLDIQARDICVESEDEETRQITYESPSDDEDEFQYRSKKRVQSMAQQRELVIHLFGATETGVPVRCDVTGFRPTIYLRLPEDKTSACAETIKQYIQKERIPIDQLTFKRITKKIFYGFTANTFYPFLEITVPSLSLFRNLRSLFLDESMNYVTKKPLDGPMRGKKVEVFEANLDPMLRFLHTQNIQPCGWVSVTDGLVGLACHDPLTPQVATLTPQVATLTPQVATLTPQVATLTPQVSTLTPQVSTLTPIILECDYEQVHPTKGPRVTAPFLIASWDIECFSMTGDFPVPKRTWKKAAQDICALTTDATKACELILNSLSTTQHPVDTLPKGMTPIYCQLKKSMDVIRTRLYKPAALEKFAMVLKDGSQEPIMDFLTSTLNPVIKLVGDPVIQIGTTLTRGTAESVERHLFVFPDCADIPDIVVHAFSTEQEMILGWFTWMIERNPDILIGYNIFGFDESYLWYRAEELALIDGNSPIHQFTRLFELAGEMKLEEKFLSSSAMGDNRMYIWTTHGRLQIDLFHYIKRNNVLPSYKLDEVTKHFMSGKLKKQSYDEDNQILTLEVAGAIKDVKEGRAIALLDETGETVSDKLVISSVSGSTITVHVWLDEDALGEMEDATKWVVVKDDVSPQDIFRLHREGATGRATVGKYCLQDCDLVLELYRKLETFNNSMSMANVCSVPVSYIFTRGQGIKIESLIFKQCRERNILIPVLTIPSQNGSEDSYEGAIVLDPEPGFYAQSPIGVCDFASLYPSTIVSENISHDSLLWVKDFTADGTLIRHQWGSELYDECDGYAYTDIEFDIIRPDPADMRKHPNKITCGRRICRYAQPLDGTKSTLPQITNWLLNARSAKKKEMKAEKDPERYALLDAEQLAYKLTGNSLYGQLGSSTFKIRLQALAASVTSYGRKQILFAKDAIEQFYGPHSKGDYYKGAKVVYGDTDSIFVEFNPRSPDTGELLQGREARVATIDITDEAGAFITKVLAPPHDFEFDKCFDPLLMFSKKRYAGNMYENNADDYVHKYMGIALKRRDNAPIVKTIFGGAMKMLLDKRDVAGAFHFVKEKCLELVEGKVSLGQLTVTKSLRADYADPSRIAHKALADRITERDPGNAPAAGDRIGYVYISAKAGQQASKLQGERIETPLFIKEHKLVPDYQHYIEHQLQNPISQAFGLLLEQVPGFTQDMMNGCPSLKDDLDRYLTFREGKAAQLLFQDCLKRYHMTSTRSAVMQMFGGKAVVTAKSAAVAASARPVTRAATSETKTKTTQTTMSSFLFDSFLVDNIKKKERAAAKKKKEEASAISSS